MGEDRVGRRSRRTFSTEIIRRRFDGVVIYFFFTSDFKFFDDASEFSQWRSKALGGSGSTVTWGPSVASFNDLISNQSAVFTLVFHYYFTVML